ELVAGFDGGGRDAAAHERVDTEHLDGPFLALAVGLRLEVYPGVGIRPLDLRDRARDLDGAADVELRRERVVRTGVRRREGRSQDGCRKSRCSKESQPHVSPWLKEGS